jgi:predicted NBD/HSP70 family sugar kinase
MTAHMFGTLTPAQRKVLETVWRMGPIARHEIAGVTGLTGASITRLTRDLGDLGLIVESVARDGARGQPARPVSLAPAGAFALGVNFSHSFVDIGLINMRGETVAHERATLPEPDPLAIASIACDALERLRMRARVPLKRIVGVGFSVPGDFRADGRFHAHAYFPLLAEKDLRALFAAALPVPVIVENDAASAALGERIHGAGIAIDTFMLIHIGHGVGGGLVLDGKLFRGAHDNAGMIGVNFPLDQPRPSGQDLFAVLAAAGIAAGDFDALETIDLAHPAVQNWVARAGGQLADALWPIIRVIDPQAVILGGRLPPRLQAALFDAMPLGNRLGSDLAGGTLLPGPRVLNSAMGMHAGVIGAAAICFSEAFFNHR